MFQILTNLEKAYESNGNELLKSFEKTSVLATIDDTWKEHLRELDDLKQSVQAATYEQKDPLLIYKFESFELFKVAIDKINKDVVSSLLKGTIPLQDSSQVQQAAGPRRLDLSSMEQTKSDAQSAYEGGGGNGQPQAPQQKKVEPVRTGRKIGRNEIVKVRYQNGNVVETKYKKVEQDINSGACVLTS
jgi:preprotein translocase subunit SecA